MEIFLMIELMYREKKFQFCKEAMPGSEKKKKKSQEKTIICQLTRPQFDGIKDGG